MKRLRFLTALLFIALAENLLAQTSRIHLPNGWALSPVGKSLNLGDLPLNIAISPDKRLMVASNNGQGVQSLTLLSLEKGVLDELVVPVSWYGLKFSTDGKRLFASAGNQNVIKIYSVSENKLRLTDSLLLGKPWPAEKISPAGIELDASSKRLFTVTKEDSSLYVLDLRTRRRLFKAGLGSEAFTCLFRPGTHLLYISLWGSNLIRVFDTDRLLFLPSLRVGEHPSELTFNKLGTLLFTSNANDNSVSIVDTRKGREIERLNTAIFPSRLPGSTPNSSALSEDEKTLFVANADNNCLAVFDVSHRGRTLAKGFVPTGWYPTQVKFAKGNLYVANGKGFSSLANPKGPNPLNAAAARHLGPSDRQYIGSLMKGTLSIIPLPTPRQLARYTQMVYKNTPHPSLDTLAAGLCKPVPCSVGANLSPVKYVFYVIKENRTYDQVLGDLPEGNGDTSLCLFPNRITPNQHALSKTFVLFDNFYVDAEVSADGHNWSMAAYANDYVEKTWPVSYGNRGGTYDYEGTRKIASPLGGFIWDHAARQHISYRTYGEFADYGKVPLKSLKGHVCARYPGFNMNIADSLRERIWERDFDSLLAAGKVPQLSTIRLGNDHTAGQRLGQPTVMASLADNDQAVGNLVDHLSHSSVWNESMVFILEDDAQNGADHVDAHRSPAYIAGPYAKRAYVDHTPYSTSGMLRTIELILGMKPMSQYDASATPFYAAVTNAPTLTPFTSIKPQVDTRAKNTAWNRSAEKSQQLNFAAEDATPDALLNEIVWKAVKGETSLPPVPRRSAFVRATEKDLD